MADIQQDDYRTEAIICESDDPKVVSITEAARINGVTRQAIYVAIKQNKLKATKETTRWTIHLDDLENYRNQKYSRAKSTYNGELLYDNSRGFFSVNQVAKMLGVPAQKIYYATRIGLLKASRRGAAWVVQSEDLKSYKENYLDAQKASAEQRFQAM
ncbi:MAG: helix-turn-helix domain-containing protein [Simkaniaceae bacterium]|nr:helix-turn-helix domain-containing protein [Simkaniaceae bacterium]MCF7852280.1 helix-turn-helix domain-containing protein [Simkaniaceae bacterium]